MQNAQQAGTLRLLAGNIDAEVIMHPSQTSAVVTFVDDKGHLHRVSLAARRGGGAMATWVPKRYEDAVHELGDRLWPRVLPASPALARAARRDPGPVAPAYIPIAERGKTTLAR
jgi:hypothetical protein